VRKVLNVANTMTFIVILPSVLFGVMSHSHC